MSFILHRQLLLDMTHTRRVLICTKRPPEVPEDLTHRKFESGSTRTRSRVLGSCALLVEAVQFQLSFGKLWREPDTKWFDLTFVPMPKNMQRFALQYRKEPHVFKKCGKQLRAAENFENRVEGQRLLLANSMEDTWLQISPLTRNLETE